jgi:hypothetical protein
MVLACSDTATGIKHGCDGCPRNELDEQLARNILRVWLGAILGEREMSNKCGSAKNDESQ